MEIEHSHGKWAIYFDDFPIKISIHSGFSIAMLNNQMVYIHIYITWAIYFDDFPISKL